MTATERVFMQLSEPRHVPTTGPVAVAADPVRADVLQILHYPADASISDLEDVLRRAKDLKLNSREEGSIRHVLAKPAGEKFRGESKPSELKRLGWKETPKGPIDPQTSRGFEHLRVTGMQAIRSCVNHQGKRVIASAPCVMHFGKSDPGSPKQCPNTGSLRGF